MLSTTIVVDRIEVTESGYIQVRTCINISDGGKEIARNFHRYVLAPGEDITHQNERVSAVARAVWTPEVMAAHRSMIQMQTARIE